MEFMKKLVEVLGKIAESSLFQNFIIGVILAAGVIVGIQTYPSVVESHGHILDLLDTIILWIFVAEIVIKMGAEGRRPWRYFFDPWNIFDFVIVAVCFLPIGAEYVAVLRLARVVSRQVVYESVGFPRSPRLRSSRTATSARCR